MRWRPRTNIDTKQVTEWNVGCEQCHARAATMSATQLFNILNRRGNYVQPTHLHTVSFQGQPRPIPSKATLRLGGGYAPIEAVGLLLEETASETTFPFPDARRTRTACRQ